MVLSGQSLPLCRRYLVGWGGFGLFGRVSRTFLCRADVAALVGTPFRHPIQDSWGTYTPEYHYVILFETPGILWLDVIAYSIHPACC